jgi:aryl-alcohol dehydrogenase-like predicted oxidoreductase
VQYAFLGRTGVRVSRISLGAAAFGVAPVAEDAVALVRRALELGVNFIDTANAYGMSSRFDRPGAPRAGERPVSEEIIGDALKGRRHAVILATKVSERVGEGPNSNGLSRVHVMQQIEQSLRRLQTDYVDVYYCHHTDPNTPIEETLDTFDVLIRQGKVRYCALSNFLGYETAEAVLKADKLGLHAPVCVQNSYSFLDRRPETEVLPACRKFGLSFYGFSPVAGGLLGGASVLERQVAGRARWGGKPLGEDEARTIMWWDAAAKEAGVPPGQLALAWQLQKPGVSGVVIGPERIASLESSCAAVDLDLPPDLFERLEQSYAEAKAAGQA